MRKANLRKKVNRSFEQKKKKTAAKLRKAKKKSKHLSYGNGKRY
jgi:hypothetical protein